MGTPNERQREFLGLVDDQQHNRLFYGGARGGGKSWSIRRAAIGRRLRYPGSRGLILRRTYEELYGNHILKLLKELPQGSFTYNQQQHRFTFPNGSIQEFGYCKNDADVLRYQGQEYDDIAPDEITQWKEIWLDWLAASCRTTRTDLRPLIFCGGNPGGIGHGWVKRRWIDRDFTERESPDQYVFIPAKVYDNPVLMENDPDYVHSLEALPDELRRAWLDGDWDVFAGQYFTELRRDKHGYRGDTPPGWTFRMFDYGTTAPSAVYWARVDHDGDIWLFKEFYRGTIYSELKREIHERTGGEEVRYTIAPHDIFAKSRETGVTGAEIFNSDAPEYGGFSIPVVKGDPNRIEGWRLFREWLASGRLHIHLDGCPNFWRTVPTLIHDEHKPEDMDSDGEDHAADAVRLGLMSRPRPSARSVERPGMWTAAGIERMFGGMEE